MDNTKYKILLIEDDKLDQMAFMRLVEDEKLPYDCTIAGSVSQAKSILAGEQFDIVIFDYLLGDGTAFDILDLVENTPTIIVTGSGDEEIAVKAWKSGAVDYLIKDPERNYLNAVPITIENAIKHKRTEEKLQLLSGAIMSTDDSVYITDMDNKIIFVNRAFCETYGYKEEDVIGKDSSILWIEKLQIEKTRSVFRVVESAWEVGFYHKRKDGSPFPVSLSRSSIRDANGDEVAVVGVARDISERILVEDKLRTINQELKWRNRLSSKLALTVTKELRTPLTALENIICDARAGAMGKISPRLQENLDLAEKGINRVTRIVSDFLEISNIDADKMKLKQTKFSFRSVVSEVIEALSPLAAEKNVELKSFMPDSELVIDTDRNRIVQALTNLIGNSINYVPVNGHIDVRVRDLGNEITVEVQDDGPSIESSEVGRIFNRLVHIERQSGHGTEGSAPDLLTAKELPETNGRYTWAESEDGQGNNFCFTLPKSDVQKEVATAVKIEIASQQSDGHEQSK